MDKAFIASIIVIVLELAGFSVSRGRGILLLAFYTQLSNIVTLISCVCYLVNSDAAFTIALRYLSTVMLAMTVLVTLFVLVPYAGFVDMMLSGNGLYHHTLCPAISITSYFLWEQHSSMWFIPVIVTFIYGIILLYLNHVEVIDGPYPFFRIHHQSVKATVIWMIALTLLVTVLSLGIAYLAK